MGFSEKGLRNKPFPYYDELCLIFGKHRGNRAVKTYETSDYTGHMSKQEEQFSVLVGIVAAVKGVADKRTKLNGELKKIPNLSLQARLRAASVIVGDSAKLDLFYSLSNEERKEWVSMLLSGLI